MLITLLFIVVPAAPSIAVIRRQIRDILVRIATKLKPVTSGNLIVTEYGGLRTRTLYHPQLHLPLLDHLGILLLLVKLTIRREIDTECHPGPKHANTTRLTKPVRVLLFHLLPQA